MPQTFKVLASITVWVLFIFGLLTLAAAVVRILGAATGMSDQPGALSMIAYFGSAIASLFLSVVAMKLRKGLD